MVLSSEFAHIQTLLLHLLQTLFHHLGDKFLRFDERHLDVAVAVAVQAELESYLLGQALVKLGIGRAKVGMYGNELVVVIEAGELVVVGGQHVVKLGDEYLHRRDELY